MAPRQLLLELEDVNMAAEKGPKRVHVGSADDSSMQVRLPARATACITLLALPSALLPLPDHSPELRLLTSYMGSECNKDTFGRRSTPQYYYSFGCPLQHPTGFSNFQSDF
eukprot:scaffold2244_cov91-Isochrysis_galbana.AAC.7